MACSSRQQPLFIPNVLDLPGQSLEYLCKLWSAESKVPGHKRANQDDNEHEQQSKLSSGLAENLVRVGVKLWMLEAPDQFDVALVSVAIRVEVLVETHADATRELGRR